MDQFAFYLGRSNKLKFDFIFSLYNVKSEFSLYIICFKIH